MNTKTATGSSFAVVGIACLMIALALGGVTWVIAESLVGLGLNGPAPTEPVPETTNILPSEDYALFLLWLLLLPMTVFMLVFSCGVALSGPGRSRRRARSKPAARATAKVPPVVPNPPMPVIDLGPDAPPSKGDVTDSRGQ